MLEELASASIFLSILTILIVSPLQSDPHRGREVPRDEAGA